ncbi:MAG: hypothetical protein J7463_04845 [Roseiflexus sp.]|jgi:hypothetical protein|nr:hypothetical protein [Roseiflexus sp.]MBO9334587.1 hypothetical protein [Roseiflexus sp.]MBO9364971.1 hypothetical protein [Roseiflexus sp.]MBO9382646.1 hypothetical protein [Roseiflexus sp.]MBO9387614.1 hypothetical protein [Roseiflexus sp.]
MEHFPHASVSWRYHACQDVWQAAATIAGEASDLHTPWVHQHLDAPWDGQVTDVLAAPALYCVRGEGRGGCPELFYDLSDQRDVVHARLQ